MIFKKKFSTCPENPRKEKEKEKRKRMAKKKIQYLPRKPEKDKRKRKENGQLKTFCNCPGWDMSIESNSQP